MQSFKRSRIFNFKCPCVKRVFCREVIAARLTSNLMSSGRDPFGFESPKPGYSPRPITVIAQPGQEVRIVVPEGTESNAWTQYGDASRSSPPGSPDASRSSPSGSPDASRSSPSGSPDASRSSPSGSPDSAFGYVQAADSPDAFGFGTGTPRPRYSPRPITIVAQAGQEVRVIAADAGTTVQSFYGDASRSSPSGSPDASRSSPSGSP